MECGTHKNGQHLWWSIQAAQQPLFELQCSLPGSAKLREEDVRTAEGEVVGRTHSGSRTIQAMMTGRMRLKNAAKPQKKQVRER